MKRYLLFWALLTGLIILAVAVFNLVVDPYGLFRLVDRPGFNSIKPKAGTHGAMAKAYQVLRVQPRGLILGNSRAEVGLDPEHPAWPQNARPVFNLALPGTGTQTTLNYLQHALANSKNAGVPKLELVVWGIDFMDFLVDAAVPPPSSQMVKKDLRLLVTSDGSRNPERPVQQLRDYTESTLTLAAFLDSVDTLANRRNPYSEDLTPLGFNPMRDYLKITADEGYRAVFRQKDIENVKAYLRRPKDIFDASGQSSPALADLRQIVNLCRKNRIPLHLVIYPYHAHLMEIIHITGHWPAFEAWKRAVAQVAGEGKLNTESTVLLWDFSGFSEITSETIPDSKDRRTTMRWYWEAGHFKRELGDLILNRIFAPTDAHDGFGVLLNRANVDAQIATLNSQETANRHKHPQDVEELENIAVQMRAQQQKR